MKLMTINAGISKGIRGVIFPDRSFVLVPLNANWDWDELPTFDQLLVEDYTHSDYVSKLELDGANLTDSLPNLEGLSVHDDPDFRAYIYGHIKRGFGHERLLLSLDEGDVLLFVATLDYMHVPREKRNRNINKNWGAYVVGAFILERGPLTHVQLTSERLEGRVKRSPHCYCESYPDFWILGNPNKYGLFRKTVPLSKADDSHSCANLLSDHFQSAGGKDAGRHSWYRHALLCRKKSRKALDIIARKTLVSTKRGE